METTTIRQILAGMIIPQVEKMKMRAGGYNPKQNKLLLNRVAEVGGKQWFIPKEDLDLSIGGLLLY